MYSELNLDKQINSWTQYLDVFGTIPKCRNYFASCGGTHGMYNEFNKTFVINNTQHTFGKAKIDQNAKLLACKFVHCV